MMSKEQYPYDYGENSISTSSSSSSSLNSSSHNDDDDTEDDHAIVTILAADDENPVNGRSLGWRLSYLDSIPVRGVGRSCHLTSSCRPLRSKDMFGHLFPRYLLH